MKPDAARRVDADMKSTTPLPVAPHIRQPAPRTSEPILDAIPIQQVLTAQPAAPVLDAIVVGPVPAVGLLPILDAVPVPVVELEPPDAPPTWGELCRQGFSAIGTAWHSPSPLVNLFLLGWWAVGSTIEWVLGVGCLILGLAILAALPVGQYFTLRFFLDFGTHLTFAFLLRLLVVAAMVAAQLLTLGYLLEAAARVARTGRFRSGFVGVRKAARVGSVFLGTAAMLAPLYLVSGFAQSAQLIDPDGPAARRWELGLSVLTVFMLLHIVGAWSRGGKLHHFLWPSGNPLTLLVRLYNGEWGGVFGLVLLGNFYWLGQRLRQGSYYAQARDSVWDFVMGLHLPHYFWLGLRGCAVGIAWLALPVSLIALGRFLAPLGFLGAFLLILVVIYLPFLQVNLARANSFWAGFNLRAVRADFRRAPLCFVLALLVTLALAVPLYLLKIEMIPREAAWMMNLFFIASIWPARLLSGWAMGPQAFKPRSARWFNRFFAHWFFRWTARLLLLPPVAASYVVLVYLSQFTSWYGIWSLYEQHAFLLPVPFFEF